MQRLNPGMLVSRLGALFGLATKSKIDKAMHSQPVPRENWRRKANWIHVAGNRFRQVFIGNKGHKPHQGRAECARRIRQGCRGADPRSGNIPYNKLMMRLANDAV